MKRAEFSWKNPNKVNIFAQAWWPDSGRFKKPVASILLMHGLGEHSGRYEHVAAYFTQKGIAVLSCDRVGHGKSGGKRGHTAKYNHLFDDIEKLHAEAIRRAPGTPIFLYGHSMGGGLVLDYLLNRTHTGLKGVIATSPMLEAAFETPALKIKLARLVRPVLPSYSEGHGLELKYLSKDQLVREAYVKDPLVHTKITVETAMGMLDSGQRSLRTVSKINTPLLLLHGDQDGITSHKATERFAQKATGDVTLRIWEDGYHELHNDPEKLDFLSFVYVWIKERL